MADPINPPHYTEGPAKCSCGKPIECIDVSEHYSSNIGQAIQYVWRHLIKNPDPIEDLRKAAWYIEREIKRLGGLL